jgi:hypothetical protein
MTYTICMMQVKMLVCHAELCCYALVQVPGCTADLQAEGKPYCIKKREC